MELFETGYKGVGKPESIEVGDTPAVEDGGYYVVRVFSVKGYSCDPYWLYIQGPE